MSKATLYVLIGFGAAYVIFWGLILYAVARSEKEKRKNAKKPKFDERQREVQRQAYQYGFYTMIVYFLVWVLLDAFGVTWCSTYFGIFLGSSLGLTVVATLCILQDAYVAVGAKKTETVILANTGAFYILICINRLADGRHIIANGVISDDAAFLSPALLIAAIDICFFIRWRMEKRARRSADSAGSREGEQ